MGLDIINRTPIWIWKAISALLVLMLMLKIGLNVSIGGSTSSKAAAQVEDLVARFNEEACNPLGEAGTLPIEDSGKEFYNFNAIDDLEVRSGHPKRLYFEADGETFYREITCSVVEETKLCEDDDAIDEGNCDETTIGGKRYTFDYYLNADTNTLYFKVKESQD